METVIQTVGNKKSLMRSQEDNLLLEEYKRRLIEIVKHHELVFKYIEQQKIALKTKLKKNLIFPDILTMLINALLGYFQYNISAAHFLYALCLFNFQLLKFGRFLSFQLFPMVFW